MLPAITNTKQADVIPYKKSFAETMCEGYHFEVKQEFNSAGIRSVFYYKEEHSLLVTHVHSNRVHIINLETGKLRWFDHHGTTVRSVLVSNHEIISASWDGKVCITDFDSLESRLVLTDKDMGRCPYVTVSPDHQFAYSYSYDSDKNPARSSNSIRKWALHNGQLISLNQLPGYHLSIRRCGSCQVNETTLYTVSDTGHLHIYNCDTGVLIHEDFYNDHLQSLCLLPLYNLIAIGGGYGNIYLCDSSGQRILQKTNVHRYDISDLLAHPEKPDLMISIGFDGTMKIWKLPNLELAGSAELNNERLWSVTAVNDLLVTGSENGDIRIYDIKNLPEVILKGKLIVSERSYAFMPASSNSFYTSDLSMMQVTKNENCSIIENQFSEYLLNIANSFRIFKELFSSENNDQSFLRKEDNGFYQISKL